MDVVCIIGERLYHAAGSECHRTMTQSVEDQLLMLTEAQAHEVGMEPCGVCMAPNDENRAR